MAQIAGENSVPLGIAGTGAAYRLDSKEPNALSIIIGGQHARDIAAQRQAAAQLKTDQENAKAFNDAVKFKQDGSPYFAKELNNKVYAPLTGRVTEVFKANRNDTFARNVAAAPLLQQAEMETLQSAAKTKYINDQIGRFQADKNLYDSDYVGQNLSAALRNEDGTGRLPSEFDAEGWHDGLLGDHSLYKEPEVIRRATEKLAPTITQRVAEAGALGGQRSADTVRGRFVAFDGKGRAILNADGSPKLALNADTQTLLESDPLFKMKVDAREAAYNAQREADPSLPQMSRRGHISKMIGPLAFYEQTRDEQLNAQPRQARDKKADPKEVLATPTVTGQTSYYKAGGTGPNTANHYAAVGQSFGSATKPYVDVEVNSGNMEIVGQNGEATRPNLATANGRVPMRLVSRDYVLYANGKRIGRTDPFQTDEEAHQELLRTIRNSPNPAKLELRVEGRGVVVDKARTAGDGLGGAPQATGYNRVSGKATYDTSTNETQHNVIVPITQDMDAQLQRATKGNWNHYKASAQEKEVIKEVQRRGGRLITPYNNAQPLTPTKATTKPAPPTWLKPAAATNKGSKPATKPNKAADLSGGMLD
jgi:hypothetical protein